MKDTTLNKMGQQTHAFPVAKCVRIPMMLQM